MSVEIERKFLTTGFGWKVVEPVDIRQGYLNKDKARTVRVRVFGEQAYLTVKGKTIGISRSEYEYPIALQDGNELLELCVDSIIEKKRYTLAIDDLIWEVDEFYGNNEGLVIAEVELKSEAQVIQLPDWVGDEVSSDARYFNSSLAQHPFNTWT